ncbi:MAG TPA: flagellar basal-body rod protein FlgG [Terriglobia bacterium]|nr:flagellar basal-body rod protein FlgG [Terriglobia bacterium]
MLRALYTAATGMQAQQINIDTIANNIANVNTTGFKQGRAEFQDLLYQTIRPAGTASSTSTTYPVGLQLGLGTKPVATDRIQSQGDFRQTGNPYDMVIEGKGFFQVKLPNGETGYTRDGSFHINADGTLVTSDGDPLEPQITIPTNAETVTIGKDGTVSATVAGVSQQVGSIQLASFANPAGLNATGSNLFTQTTASGDAVTGAPGENGIGRVNQGFLENSNVSVVEEMVNMIIAQRAYEVNSRAVKVADDMLSQINNLIR